MASARDKQIIWFEVAVDDSLQQAENAQPKASRIDVYRSE